MKIKELEITLMSEKDVAFTFGAEKIPFKRPFKALSLTYCDKIGLVSDWSKEEL
jgi:hypothetical protein